jgi:hypothetical protein
MSRVLNSWNFPEGRFMKALATRLYDQGLRGNALVAEFDRLVPHWKTYFAKPISDGAIAQRADKARRYANENPETHPHIKRYWKTAGTAARRGKRLSKKAVHDIIRRCAPRSKSKKQKRPGHLKRTNGRAVPAPPDKGPA